jgi:hypothetical protein
MAGSRVAVIMFTCVTIVYITLLYPGPGGGVVTALESCRMRRIMSTHPPFVSEVYAGNALLDHSTSRNRWNQSPKS